MSKSEVSLTSTAYSSNKDNGRPFSGVFGRVCVYRGRVYAVRRSARDSVDITRSLKKELKVKMPSLQTFPVNLV